MRRAEALGSRGFTGQALKGRTRRGEWLVRPFRAGTVLPRFPRASPLRLRSGQALGCSLTALQASRTRLPARPTHPDAVRAPRTVGRCAARPRPPACLCDAWVTRPEPGSRAPPAWPSAPRWPRGARGWCCGTRGARGRSCGAGRRTRDARPGRRASRGSRGRPP